MAEKSLFRCVIVITSIIVVMAIIVLIIVIVIIAVIIVIIFLYGVLNWFHTDKLGPLYKRKPTCMEIVSKFCRSVSPTRKVATLEPNLTWYQFSLNAQQW